MLVDIWSSYYLSFAPWAGQSPVLTTFAASIFVLLLAGAILPPKQYVRPLLFFSLVLHIDHVLTEL